MAINTGVNASKLIGLAVLDKPAAVDVSKLVAYVVLDAAPAPQPIMVFLLP